MKRLILLFITGFSIAFFGCDRGAVNYKNLTAQGWTLDEIIYADSTYTISPPVEITINFTDSATVHGSAGCNTFLGVFRTEGEDIINIETGATTLMYCPNMEFEERYLSILNLADSYTADKDGLKIENSMNRVTLLYRPAFTL